MEQTWSAESASPPSYKAEILTRKTRRTEEKTVKMSALSLGAKTVSQPSTFGLFLLFFDFFQDLKGF